MMSGTVKFFFESKGCGFIIPDDGGEDVFVNKRALGGQRIVEGQKVEFDIVKDKGGVLAAANVRTM